MSPRSPASQNFSGVDLFSGAGGATEGMKQAGVHVLAAFEIDRDSCATYRLNHPEVQLFEGDITEIDPVEVGKIVGINKGELALLKACAPCQGFSTLGKSDPTDKRNGLVLEAQRFIEAWLPKVFIFENVPRVRQHTGLQKSLKLLGQLGYSVRQYLVNAADFGVPQYRKRLIIVGVRNSANSTLPDSLHDENSVKHVTVREVLQDYRADPNDRLNWARSLQEKTLQRVRAVPVGGSRHDLPPDLVLTCHKNLKTSAATGPYSRIAFDRPSPTMTTRCTTPSCGRFTHPQENRGLTLREAAVFQTFPNSYQFVGGYESVERQIGNAVPVLMAREISKKVLSL